MSAAPPPLVHRPTPQPHDRARTIIILAAILAFVVIVVIAAAILLPILRPKPNLRPDTLPPRVVKKVGDGWLDMQFHDLGVTVRVPGKPASSTRGMADKRFNPDFASDFIEYACTGDSCVIVVAGTWLSPPAVASLARPDALSQHATDNYDLPDADPIEVKGLPPGAEARHYVANMPGYPTNNCVQVTLLRKNNLLVDILVNTDGSKEQAVARMEKALTGFQLNDPATP